MPGHRFVSRSDGEEADGDEKEEVAEVGVGGPEIAIEHKMEVDRGAVEVLIERPTASDPGSRAQASQGGDPSKQDRR